MRSVVDSNIWVSAILTRRGNPGRVLDAFVAGRFALVTSEPLLAELADVLQRPRIAQRSRLTPARVTLTALGAGTVRAYSLPTR